MGTRVDVDTTELVRGVRQLADGLGRAGGRTALEQAQATAATVAAGVPVRTGRLRATVHAVPDGDAANVTYGDDLPYAWKIERQARAVADGIVGADEAFHARMIDTAETEVRKL